MKSTKLKKILVPLDGSENSLRGLKFAMLLAKQANLSIVGLNVYSLPKYLKSSWQIRHKFRQISNDVIDQAKIIARRNEIKFTGLSIAGENIGKTIVEFANKQDVDLIVIGSRGVDSEIEMFLGSTANYVINKSKMPVTIIK